MAHFKPVPGITSYLRFRDTINSLKPNTRPPTPTPLRGWRMVDRVWFVVRVAETLNYHHC